MLALDLQPHVPTGFHIPPSVERIFRYAQLHKIPYSLFRNFPLASDITFRYLGTPTEDEMPEYTIGALPNGYVEVDSEREEWPDYICIVYRNEVSGETIYFNYTRMTQGYVNDFEVNSDTATSSVLVNGMQGYLFQEKNWERQRSSITWIDSDKNLQFTIHAYLPQSRILQMAESVSEIP